MGFVWNILLSFDNEEWWEEGEDQPRETCEPLERINQWIPHGKLVSLITPTYRKGVGAGMDANLFGGGYQHFDIDAFIKIVEAQAWIRAHRRHDLAVQVHERGTALARASTDTVPSS